MDLGQYKEDILQEQYEEYLKKGKSHLDQENHEKAAKAFSQSLDRLEELETIRETTYPDRKEQLESSISKLKSGEALSEEDIGENRGGGAEDAEQPETDFREQVESFISQTEVTWDDIGGLDEVKGELKRTITLGGIDDKPDAVAATDRVLLFGPPGTGKTLLASAVAGSLDATFFDVKLGGLLSKYFGETSKQITALFDLAEEMSPSIVFLDEIDALTQSRESDLDETSRRVLNTLLSELDGIDKSDDSFVMVLGSTNTPWDLDQAIRRRFPRRVLIPLPDVGAAEEIVAINTVEGGITFEGDSSAFQLSDTGRSVDTPVEAIASECIHRGYTGSDVEAVCRTAVNAMINRSNTGLASVADRGFDAVREYDLSVDAVRPQDVQVAFERTSASLSEESVRRFDEWDREFGSGA
ncbi:ATP-binding protein [Halomicrobium katesii]|uniref:ATP-binding protein n=1 Tax=Halomicrobium katesii TaxID=437163 RepID=UPI00036407CA|nr:ATP-binding protein [Halomicrobium katesii]